MNVRKSCLMVQSVWQWNRLPGKMGDSPVLEVFKQRVDSHLLGMLQLWSACTGRGLDSMSFSAPSKSDSRLIP